MALVAARRAGHTLTSRRTPDGGAGLTVRTRSDMPCDRDPGDLQDDSDMAEDKHKRGEMDISEQEKTFSGFMRMSVNIGIVVVVIIILLAIFAI